MPWKRGETLLQEAKQLELQLIKDRDGMCIPKDSSFTQAVLRPLVQFYMILAKVAEKEGAYRISRQWGNFTTGFQDVIVTSET